MLGSIKKGITHALLNVPGWRTNRKIVVIESDDWGSIRMPSVGVYKKLKELGYHPETDTYLRYDSLASEEDLTALFDVLCCVTDCNGRHPVLTANSIMGNPDFKKIKESNFSTYFFEPFTETLKRYPSHEKSFSLWKEGISNNLFYPQLHGREHLNVDQWMKGLQKHNALLMKAFENEMISISSEPSHMKFGYMESLDYFDDKGKLKLGPILKEGMDVFNKIFGYSSESYIANCYIWSKDSERTLNGLGVKYIQGIPFQYEPFNDYNGHFLKKKYHFLGQKNSFEQRYLVRNVHFEPSEQHANEIVNETLKRIDLAFMFKKPAIISSHRVNFIGGIDPKNRAKNLKLFKVLLQQIVKRWPNVEFMTTVELGKFVSRTE